MINEAMQGMRIPPIVLEILRFVEYRLTFCAFRGSFGLVFSQHRLCFESELLNYNEMLIYKKLAANLPLFESEL
jgi:hypothetical protein